MKRDLFKARLLSLVALCSFMLMFASCANEGITQKKTDTDNNNDKNLTTFATGTAPESRTSMDYNSGAFFWEVGDYIYVKDDNDVWQKSNNAPTDKTNRFSFIVPGKFTDKTSYKVYYPGKNGYQDKVTIPVTQTQAKPNTTTHFGMSGDCGTATATKVAGVAKFEFKLDHQAAYLVFQPYTSNTVLKNCYITKIEVNSDNDISSTYTLDPTTGELTGTGSGKQIVLTTKDPTYGSANYNGFPLTNNSPSVETNGALMAIKPGMHTFTIRYWIQDIATDVEGTITKTLSAHTFDKNKYYNMTADLNIRDYSAHNYYMWDAKQNYWAGHEWDSADPWQRPVMGWSGTKYAKSKTDPRYCNTSFPGPGIQNLAQTPLFKTLPNNNEMLWYVEKGDPHWDADELWSTMGHLYKGGMWLKKKAYITNFSSTDYPAGTDGRNDNISKQPLSASEINKYFYLPAMGRYVPFGLGDRESDDVNLSGIGVVCLYWTSEADRYNQYGAPFLELDANSAILGSLNYNRNCGYIAQPFE